jgi:hypothetical protein
MVKIAIPDAKASFGLFNNIEKSRGKCTILGGLYRVLDRLNNKYASYKT